MNHAMMICGFVLILLLSPGCERESNDHLVMNVAGKYTCAIGEQVWQTTMFNTHTFQNGDMIPQAQSNEEWAKAGRLKLPAWCYGHDNSGIVLYNWYAISDPRGLIPTGWHLPSYAEIEYVKILLYTLNHLDHADNDIVKAYPDFGSVHRDYQKDIEERYSLPFTYHGHRLGDGAYKGNNAIAVCWTSEEPETATGYIPVFAQRNDKKQIYTIASHPSNGVAIRLIKD